MHKETHVGTESRYRTFNSVTWTLVGREKRVGGERALRYSWRCEAWAEALFLEQTSLPHHAATNSRAALARCRGCRRARINNAYQRRSTDGRHLFQHG
eukprot:scaffold214409_cov33-Tisochrysis_lutea.AAC.5